MSARERPAPTLPFDPPDDTGLRGAALAPPDPWASALAGHLDPGVLEKVAAFVESERTAGVVHPDPGQEFRALELTPPEAVRAVVLGQDPYHGPGQAHGLAFSVRPGVDPPPSLRNIFRELGDDLGIEPPEHGCLEDWARRGVLLLNTVLTVRTGEAGSHRGQGWETVTDAVIRAIADSDRPVVFALWGNSARAKAPLVHQPPHTIVESTHPSPLSAHRGFLGSRPFSAINEALASAGREPIDWRL